MRKYRRRTAAVLVLVGTITLLSPLLARASTSTGDASAVRTAHAAFLVANTARKREALGLYKSTDDGAHWSRVPGPRSQRVPLEAEVDPSAELPPRLRARRQFNSRSRPVPLDDRSSVDARRKGSVREPSVSRQP
jgi:hypothetical protein